ncbi:MAG: hypothetical protein M3O70_03485 [Actinomycetota bacterium]|nr:hypothetical protein [Actinomycetota bacterium]
MDELLQHLAVASDVSREKPIQRLREATAAVADRVGPRETAVLEQLVELADVTLKQVQRVHHIRDESKPIAGWDELRRTGFVLAMLMHELDKVAES